MSENDPITLLRNETKSVLSYFRLPNTTSGSIKFFLVPKGTILTWLPTPFYAYILFAYPTNLFAYIFHFIILI